VKSLFNHFSSRLMISGCPFPRRGIKEMDESFLRREIESMHSAALRNLHLDPFQGLAVRVTFPSGNPQFAILDRRLAPGYRFSKVVGDNLRLRPKAATENYFPTPVLNHCKISARSNVIAGLGRNHYRHAGLNCALDTWIVALARQRSGVARHRRPKCQQHQLFRFDASP
jgi:hypothetical protein